MRSSEILNLFQLDVAYLGITRQSGFQTRFKPPTTILIRFEGFSPSSLVFRPHQIGMF